jgi:antitoxin component of RelBE/YafQ-DinJ toxin-antitoxin module
MSKKHLLQIRLDETHKTSLEQLCLNEKITVSEKIRELIEEHVMIKKNNSIPKIHSNMGA